jgi:hypothetical protein
VVRPFIASPGDISFPSGFFDFKLKQKPEQQQPVAAAESGSGIA